MDQYIDVLQKKKTWRCEKHNILISGLETRCPMCELERRFPKIRIEVGVKKRYRPRKIRNIVIDIP